MKEKQKKNIPGGSRGVSRAPVEYYPHSGSSDVVEVVVSAGADVDVVVVVAVVAV